MLMADIDGKLLSSMFLIFSGKRASYLYGAFTSATNNLMVSSALQ